MTSLLQGIVDLHQYPVVGIIFHFIGNLEYKRAISAAMFADMHIINKNIRYCIDSFKTQKRDVCLSIQVLQTAFWYSYPFHDSNPACRKGHRHCSKYGAGSPVLHF